MLGRFAQKSAEPQRSGATLQRSDTGGSRDSPCSLPSASGRTPVFLLKRDFQLSLFLKPRMTSVPPRWRREVP